MSGHQTGNAHDQCRMQARDADRSVVSSHSRHLVIRGPRLTAALRPQRRKCSMGYVDTRRRQRDVLHPRNTMNLPIMNEARSICEGHRNFPRVWQRVGDPGLESHHGFWR